MRFLFILLSAIAAFLSTLLIGLIAAIIFKGEFNILLPGFGLVISGYGVILLLAIVDFAVIALALFFRSMSRRN